MDPQIGEIILTTGGYYTVRSKEVGHGGFASGLKCSSPGLDCPVTDSMGTHTAVRPAPPPSFLVPIKPAPATPPHPPTHLLHPQATTLNCMNDILCAIDCEVDAKVSVRFLFWGGGGRSRASKRFERQKGRSVRMGSAPAALSHCSGAQSGARG
jgi:hypothetical protein